MSDLFATLAPKDAVPKFKSGQPLAALGLGPEEGFVLSRVDGVTRLGELVNLVPFPVEQTLEIIRRLWIGGAIEIPGHTVPVISEKPVPRTAGRSGTAIPVMGAPTAVPAGIELTLEQVKAIDTMFAELNGKNAFELLGVERGCDKKDIKRAYFKLSKDFHPDRFYGKKLGPYADRLATIFQAIKAAFDLLFDDARRAAYEDSL